MKSIKTTWLVKILVVEVFVTLTILEVTVTVIEVFVIVSEVYVIVVLAVNVLGSVQFNFLPSEKSGSFFSRFLCPKIGFYIISPVLRRLSNS